MCEKESIKDCTAENNAQKTYIYIYIGSRDSVDSTEEIPVNYTGRVHPRIRDYFEMLAPDAPDWLNKYINTTVLLRQSGISPTCGAIYSALYESNKELFFSNLDHSIGTALITWNFTKDKRATLASLFHDVSTPAFKHCVDHLNGDHLEQESTEGLTRDMILKSKEVMALLERDEIEVDEIVNDSNYSIANNQSPRLSADRLEYTLSNALFIYDKAGVEKIRRIYNDITVFINEDREKELGFETVDIAEEFVEISSKLSQIYSDNRAKYQSQYMADLFSKLIEGGVLTQQYLNESTDEDVIKKIKDSKKYAKIYKKLTSVRDISVSTGKPSGDIYWVSRPQKVRYINPLVKIVGTEEVVRIADISEEAHHLIQNTLLFNEERKLYVFAQGVPDFRKW